MIINLIWDFFVLDIIIHSPNKTIWLIPQVLMGIDTSVMLQDLIPTLHFNIAVSYQLYQQAKMAPSYLKSLDPIESIDWFP